VTGACLAEVGKDALYLDVDEGKVALLKNGGIPIYGLGLEDMVKRNVASGRLRFTTDMAESVTHGSVQGFTAYNL
jgi:UDPglucose 6-dehydrogenase